MKIKFGGRLPIGLDHLMHTKMQPKFPRFPNFPCQRCNSPCIINKKLFSLSPFLSHRTSSGTFSSSPTSGEGIPGSIKSPIRITPSPLNLYSSLDRLKDVEEFFLIEKEGSREESRQNIRTEYKYEIVNKNDEKLFLVSQVYETFPARFDLRIYEPEGQLILIHKLLQNLSSHLLNMQIINPGGQYLGSIEEKIEVNEEKPSLFEVKNSYDEVEAVVLSDFSNASNTMYGLRRSVQILSPCRKEVLGKISKKWNGFGDSLAVGIQFSDEVNLDTKFRASLIGLSILMNNRYIR